MADPKAPATPVAPPARRARPMLVVSTAEGVYNGLRVRKPGFKFYLDDPAHYSWEWMEILDATDEQRSKIRKDTRTLVKKRSRSKKPVYRVDGRPVRAGGPVSSGNPAALDEDLAGVE